MTISLVRFRDSERTPAPVFRGCGMEVNCESALALALLSFFNIDLNFDVRGSACCSGPGIKQVMKQVLGIRDEKARMKVTPPLRRWHPLGRRMTCDGT